MTYVAHINMVVAEKEKLIAYDPAGDWFVGLHSPVAFLVGLPVPGLVRRETHDRDEYPPQKQ